MICETVQLIPLGKIKCDDIRQQRDAGALRSLQLSLAEVGQLYPIRLRPQADGYAIVDGHRRFAAQQALGATVIAAIIEDKPLTEGEAIQQALISNIQRESLSPVETAQAIARLMETTGWNATETAKRLGFSASSVTKSLAILNLPADIVQRIAAKEIPATAAYDLARVTDSAKQAELARQLASGDLTRDAVSRGGKRRRKATRSAGLVKRALVKLSEGVSLAVAGKRFDYDSFIAACESAVAKAKRARAQNLSFETFLKAAADQAAAEG